MSIIMKNFSFPLSVVQKLDGVWKIAPPECDLTRAPLNRFKQTLLLMLFYLYLESDQVFMVIRTEKDHFKSLKMCSVSVGFYCQEKYM